MKTKKKLNMEIIGIDTIRYDSDLRDWISKPDKHIIKEEEISIVYDYPVKWSTYLIFKSKGGFTKYQLYKCIYQGYKQLEDGGMIINHVLDHLWLEGVEYNKTKKICTLEISS